MGRVGAWGGVFGRSGRPRPTTATASATKKPSATGTAGTTASGASTVAVPVTWPAAGVFRQLQACRRARARRPCQCQWSTTWIKTKYEIILPGIDIIPCLPRSPRGVLRAISIKTIFIRAPQAPAPPWEWAGAHTFDQVSAKTGKKRGEWVHAWHKCQWQF